MFDELIFIDVECESSLSNTTPSSLTPSESVGLVGGRVETGVVAGSPSLYQPVVAVKLKVNSRLAFISRQIRAPSPG